MCWLRGCRAIPNRAQNADALSRVLRGVLEISYRRGGTEKSDDFFRAIRLRRGRGITHSIAKEGPDDSGIQPGNEVEFESGMPESDFSSKPDRIIRT